MPSLRSLIFGGQPGTKRFPLLCPPALVIDEQKRAVFERYTAETVDSRIGKTRFELAHPMHEYLRWLSRERRVLFHGSPSPFQAQLDPRRAKGTDVAGSQRAVYATPWPLYAMWFAVLNRSLPFIWTTNGSRAVSALDHSERVYWFKVNRWARRPSLLTHGTLYILRRQGFAPVAGSGNDEDCASQWISRRSIHPLVGIAVGPEDFPFASQVTGAEPRVKA